MDVRSATGAPGCASTFLYTGRDSPVIADSSTSSEIASRMPAVGVHRLAGGEFDHVADDQRVGWELADNAFDPDAGRWDFSLLERVERTLGLYPLNRAHQRVADHDAAHERGVSGRANRRRQGRAEDEQRGERVGDLVDRGTHDTDGRGDDPGGRRRLPAGSLAAFQVHRSTCREAGASHPVRARAMDGAVRHGEPIGCRRAGR